MYGVRFDVHDRILIEGLRLSALIGVYPHELAYRQPVEIDVQMFTDVRKAARNADFKKTIDYERAAKIVRDVVLKKHHKLVESVCEEIAAALKDEFLDQL